MMKIPVKHVFVNCASLNP